jgi:hypothetical protein
MVTIAGSAAFDHRLTMLIAPAIGRVSMALSIFFRGNGGQRAFFAKSSLNVDWLWAY